MPLKTCCPVAASDSVTASFFPQPPSPYHHPAHPAPSGQWQLARYRFPPSPRPHPILPAPQLSYMPVHLATLLQPEQIRPCAPLGFLHHPLGSPTDVTPQQTRPLLPRPVV